MKKSEADISNGMVEHRHMWVPVVEHELVPLKQPLEVLGGVPTAPPPEGLKEVVEEVCIWARGKV